VASDGLGDLWREVVSSIEQLSLSGCYEKVNRFMSLGLIDKLRRRTASLVSGETILDAGAGPGTSARVILEVHPGTRVVLLDPSGPMLSYALQRLSTPRVHAVVGRFEAMPLPDNSIDGIVAMFSYRDAVSYTRAADEFARVLKPSGSVALLDFYRPVRPVKALIKLYLAVMVPLALAAGKCSGKLSLYKGFLATIDRMLGKRELIELFSGRFEYVRLYTIVPGLAILHASRPKKGG